MKASMLLHDFAPSINSMKVRIALAFKGIPSERKTHDFPLSLAEREEMVRLSGQPLLPILLDASVVVVGSRCILHHLDANYRETAPLYSPDREEMWQIEQWEDFGSRLEAPFRRCLLESMERRPDPSVGRRAGEAVRTLCRELEETLPSSGWLVGDRLTAADVTCAPPLFYATLPSGAAALSPIHAFFVEHFGLGEDFEHTRRWVKAVVKHDSVLS